MTSNDQEVLHMEEAAIAVINTKLDNILYQLTGLTAGQAGLDSRVRILETSDATVAARLAALERVVDRPKGTWQASAATVASVLSVLLILGALVYLGPHV